MVAVRGHIHRPPWQTGNALDSYPSKTGSIPVGGPRKPLWQTGDAVGLYPTKRGSIPLSGSWLLALWC